MKELSIEEKVKAYDEALKRAKDMLSYKEVRREDMEYLFPELTESEDDRIMKGIIRNLEYLADRAEGFVKDELKERIAWLEKQGKQKGYTFKSIPRLLDMIEPSDKAKAYCQKLIDVLAKEGYDTDAKIVEGVLKGWDGEDVPMAVMDEQKPVFEMKTPEESLGIDSDTYNKIVDECIYGEQKPTDKVKPKFKVGDWIVQGCNILKIRCFDDKYYCFETVGGYVDHMLISEIDSLYHLWTIQNTKDGYVLSDGTTIFIFEGSLLDGSVMSYCDYDTDSGESDAFCPFSMNLICSKITPATKEQRDLLFQKMHEAGYEWDAEKKELKKINSYCQENCKGFQEIGKCFTDGECKAKREAEQKPTDEDMKEALRTEYEKGRADAIVEMQNPAWSEEDESYLNTTIAYLKDAKEFKKSAENCINWLKSLKDRVQPRRRHTIFDEII